MLELQFKHPNKQLLSAFNGVSRCYKGQGLGAITRPNDKVRVGLFLESTWHRFMYSTIEIFLVYEFRSVCF